jgi:hypothetical protein
LSSLSVYASVLWLCRCRCVAARKASASNGSPSMLTCQQLLRLHVHVEHEFDLIIISIILGTITQCILGIWNVQDGWRIRIGPYLLGWFVGRPFSEQLAGRHESSVIEHPWPLIVLHRCLDGLRVQFRYGMGDNTPSGGMEVIFGDVAMDVS